jgi:cellulose synthase/poly-beta-1,6-N-acetylglucosamine synthase-like glycosyltransferase
MEQLTTFLGYILITTIICLFALQVVADVNEIKRHQTLKSLPQKPFRSRLAIIIKAHNHQDTIIKCLEALYTNVTNKVEIILVISGSSDKTHNKARYYKRKNQLTNLTIINQQKGQHSIARIINQRASGAIIGILDANHIIGPQTIKNSLIHFNDKELTIVVPRTKVTVDNTFTSALLSLQAIIANYFKAAAVSLYMPSTAVFFRKKALNGSGDALELKGHRAVYASNSTLLLDIPTSSRTALKQFLFSKNSIIATLALLSPLGLLSILFFLGTYQELPVLQFSFLFLGIFTLLIVGSVNNLGLVQKISLVLFAPFAYTIFVLGSLAAIPSKALLLLPSFSDR